MPSDAENLTTLEALMHDFFNTGTSNQRKHEIEDLLDNFVQQRGCWKPCLYFLSETTSPYVSMFSLNTVENIINRKWVGLLGEEKSEIRSTLYQFLLEHHETVPSFIRNKLVKLVVDIARIDWPHFYPDFFTNVLNLIQTPESSTLGLIFLLTCSEELACPREDLSVLRKEELRKLLLEQVPYILNILTGILDAILDKQKHVVTATPPPSPTHGQPNEGSSLFSTSPVHTGSLLNRVFKSLGNKNPFWTVPPMDNDNEKTCALVLQCLTHLFSWIPLSSCITSHLINCVFHFASMGADPQHNKVPCHQLGPCDSPSLGVLAMGAINELMYKNCVPTDFEDFLLKLFQNTFHLLQRLTQDAEHSDRVIRLEHLDTSYLEKFTEFLLLFVNIHLRRFEGNSQFPVLEFMALLFKYTFHQPTNEGFYLCLEIWGVFLDYLATRLRTRRADHQAILNKYHEALVSLVRQVTHRFQFQINQSKLDLMDDENLDDDDETQWQHFLRQCVEVIAKVAEILPGETFTLVYEPWKLCADVYLGLHIQYDGSDSGLPHLPAMSDAECSHLHCVLRDLSSLLQALGRLSSFFIGEPFVERYRTAHGLIEKLILLGAYGTKKKLFLLDSSNIGLKSDFIEVHAQALAALKAWSHWIAQWYTEVLHDADHLNQCNQLIKNIAQLSVPLVYPRLHVGTHTVNTPTKISHSAIHLLVTLTGTVRPPVFLEIPCIRDLYTKSSKLHGLSYEANRLLCRALTNILLLPWPGVIDQQWDQRQDHLTAFIKSLSGEFRKIREVDNFGTDKAFQTQARTVIKLTLGMLRDQTESIQPEVNKTKQLYYTSIQEIIQQTLWLFPIYVQQPDVCEEILSFFLTIFDVLQSHLGPVFSEEAVQTFLNVFTREQLTYTILHENQAGSRVIEKFLKILQLIVKEPRPTFSKFVPSTISLCMEDVYPVIAERPSPEIKAPLFELLYCLLLYNWTYFFKSSLFTTLGVPGNEVVECKDQFLIIMQAFGQSFLQPDIGIFRQNLESLEKLNAKWKLYHKGLFRQSMLAQFLTVLLQVLVHRSHDLLREEIAITVYNMASVDFDTFFLNFLPHFLMTMDGLDDNQRGILKENFKMETDLPSFTQNVQRFVNDLRFYRLCNASLAPGSVKL